jgi:hypothetical protein
MTPKLNSDGFFNQEVSLLSRHKYVDRDHDTNGHDHNVTPGRTHHQHRLHGILGQTVRLKRYKNRWRYIEGDIDLYQVESILDHSDRFSIIKY